jgi:hypothetical protein
MRNKSHKKVNIAGAAVRRGNDEDLVSKMTLSPLPSADLSQTFDSRLWKSIDWLNPKPAIGRS